MPLSGPVVAGIVLVVLVCCAVIGLGIWGIVQSSKNQPSPPSSDSPPSPPSSGGPSPSPSSDWKTYDKTACDNQYRIGNSFYNTLADAKTNCTNTPGCVGLGKTILTPYYLLSQLQVPSGQTVGGNVAASCIAAPGQSIQT
jgi:hypothetical protein